MERSLIELIQKRQASQTSHGQIELEIRVRNVDREEFEAVIKAADELTGQPPTLESSISAISVNALEATTINKTDDTQYIRRQVFSNNPVTGTKNEYMQKTKLVKPIPIPGYKKCFCALALEKTTGSHVSRTDAMIRFKNRLSWKLVVGEIVWRLDVTAVKSGYLNEIGSELKRYRDEFFTGLTATNFIEKLNHELIDTYEIEIELDDAAGWQKITPSDIIAAVATIFKLISADPVGEMGYQDEIYFIAKNIIPAKAQLFTQSSHRLKMLSNQAIALSKTEYYYGKSIFPPIGYYLTNKADGERAIITKHDNKITAVFAASLEVIGTYEGEQPTSIVDTECITLLPTKGKPSQRIFAVFDVMMLANTNMIDKPFSERVDSIGAACEAINLPIVVPKTYAIITDDLEQSFGAVHYQKPDYKLDGMILTTPSAGYFDTINYKWKPLEQSTIDFCAIKCPQQMLGIKPFNVRPGMTLYILFVGISHNNREKLGLGFLPHHRLMFEPSGQYYAIQFAPSISPLAYIYYHDSSVDLHQKIIELGVTKDQILNADGTTNWIFHRQRDDRKLEKTYFGNAFHIAELTYMNFIDPFNYEDLYKHSDSYFTKSTARADNKYRRYVISRVMKDTMSGSQWVIDLAAGRGADLARYQEIGVNHTLFIDIDPAAISELIRRKLTVFAAKKRQIKGSGPGAAYDLSDAQTQTVLMYDCTHDIEYDKLMVKTNKAMTVHTMVADLTMPTVDLISRTFQFGLTCGIVDNIVCNFALHYMCGQLEHIRGVLLFCTRMLKVGGSFMFTTLDGSAVFDLLKNIKRGESWTVTDPITQRAKFQIMKKYTGTTLANTGQTISVLLSSISDNMYDEPLCNIDFVIKEAERLGFAVELNYPMGKYLPDFAKHQHHLYEQISDDDKTFINLYRLVTLRKIKDSNIKTTEEKEAMKETKKGMKGGRAKKV